MIYVLKPCLTFFLFLILKANPKLLKRTMELLNEDTATRRYHLLNGSWPWMMGFGTCPFTLFVCLAIFLGSLLFESTAHPSEEVASFVRAGHWVAWVPFAIGGAITFPLIGYWYTMKKKTEKVDIVGVLMDDTSSLTETPTNDQLL